MQISAQISTTKTSPDFHRRHTVPCCDVLWLWNKSPQKLAVTKTTHTCCPLLSWLWVFTGLHEEILAWGLSSDCHQLARAGAIMKASSFVSGAWGWLSGESPAGPVWQHTYPRCLPVAKASSQHGGRVPSSRSRWTLYLS